MKRSGLPLPRNSTAPTRERRGGKTLHTFRHQFYHFVIYLHGSGELPLAMVAAAGLLAFVAIMSGVFQ